MERLCKRTSGAALVAAVEKSLLPGRARGLSVADSGEGGVQDDLDGSGSTNAILLFVNEWLAAVADAVAGLLLAKVLQVTALTAGGLAQLSTDLEYIR